MDEKFAEFKKKEFEERLSKLKVRMSERGVDAVLITDEKNIRWLTGYWVQTMQIDSMPTVAIIPCSDKNKPLLIMPADGTGEELTWIEDIRYWDLKASKQPFDGFVVDAGNALVNAFREFNLDKCKIGMELGRDMRVSLGLKDIDKFRNSLPDCFFIDISDILWEIRSVKSPAEIKKIKKACSITANSLKEGFKILKEGITEREFGQYLVQNWFKNGATGADFVTVGFGDYAVKYGHCIPREKALKKGDLIKFDGGCSFEGYIADIRRTACLGRPSKEKSRFNAIVKEANHEAINIIREGIKVGEVFNEALKVLEKRGIKNLLGNKMIGHSIGLSFHEQPYLTRGSNTILKAGMVIAVEPWILDYNDWKNSYNVEDDVLVTEDGYEILSDIERDIFSIV